MFTKAVDWEMIEESALRPIRRVKLLQEDNKRLRYLSAEECQNLIAASSEHLRPIVTVALNTGLRKSEIFNLEWERHIDFKHGFVLVDKSKNGQRREIPMNHSLREALEGVIRRLDIPYVFQHGRSGRQYSDIRNSFYKACRKAGITDFHFHDLRHTFASHLVMGGIDLTTVKALLGHKNISMTLRYSHLAPSHMTKAVDTLDNVLTTKPTAQKLHNLEKEH
jgi:integrase